MLVLHFASKAVLLLYLQYQLACMPKTYGHNYETTMTKLLFSWVNIWIRVPKIWSLHHPCCKNMGLIMFLFCLFFSEPSSSFSKAPQYSFQYNRSDGLLWYAASIPDQTPSDRFQVISQQVFVSLNTST